VPRRIIAKASATCSDSARTLDAVRKHCTYIRGRGRIGFLQASAIEAKTVLGPGKKIFSQLHTRLQLNESEFRTFGCAHLSTLLRSVVTEFKVMQSC